MRATLYEALGVPKVAPDEEVRAALRRQIRKYYAKTRDGHGNVEEALRFINHASRILSDPERRARYDHELSVSDGSVEQRIAHVVTVAATRAPGDSASARSAASAGVSISAAEAVARMAGGAAGKDAHHPGLTERVASFGQSTSVTIALCALFGTFIAAAIVLVTPSDAIHVAKQVLVWLTVSLLTLTLVYGVVHGIAWFHRRHRTVEPAPVALGDPAILNWRREKSVFLGTNHPQEDAGWVFQLRMAELERAKSGRTSEPHPWSRLGARLFDYAIWGLLLAIPLSELQAAGIVSRTLGFWLGHPLVAPVVITATWIPIEALLIATMQTTPGKWLFGVYLQFSISDAYASRDRLSRFLRAGKRAFRVWWEGVGCGFPLLAPILIAVTYERVTETQETPWDFAQDCLVTHGPTAGLNTITAAAGLAAMMWLYGVAWHQTMAESMAWARSTIVAMVPAPPALFRGAIPVGGGTISRAGTPPPPAFAASKADAGPPPPPKQRAAGAVEAPVDPQIAALFVERRARIAMLSAESARMLDAQNWRQAAEICQTWADLDLGNADAWRCLGRALQAQSLHRDAVKAFRKAKQYDPGDGTLDAAINRSQRGIVADFLRGRGR